MELKTYFFLTESENNFYCIYDNFYCMCRVHECEYNSLVFIMSNTIFFRLETIDGTAEANSDYKPVKKDVTFAPGQTKHIEEIEIIDDNDWEPDEVSTVS